MKGVHPQAPRPVDCACDAVADTPSQFELQSGQVDNKICTLRNLSRLGEASALLAGGEQVSARKGLAARRSVTTAVQEHQRGNWDKAIKVVDTTVDDGTGTTIFGSCGHTPALLPRGVALIAARQGAVAHAVARLGLDSYHPAAGHQQNHDFLLAAGVEVARHSGDGQRCRAVRQFEAAVVRNLRIGAVWDVWVAVDRTAEHGVALRDGIDELKNMALGACNRRCPPATGRISLWWTGFRP